MRSGPTCSPTNSRGVNAAGINPPLPHLGRRDGQPTNPFRRPFLKPKGYQMAERAQTVAEAAKPGTNFVEPDKIQSFVYEYENFDAKLLELRMDYMAKCKTIRADQKLIVDDAKDAGIPKQSFKAVLRARALEAKAKKARDDLGDIDLQDKYDLIRHALGDLADTPLGQAATNGAH
jgi:hypothetical protein